MDDRSGKLRVLQVTVGFTLGGAERIILDLARKIDRERIEISVCGLKGWGWLGEELEKIGVEAIALGGKDRLDPRVIYQFWRLLKRNRIDVIHSHLFQANILTRMVGKSARVPVLISHYHGTNIWRGSSQRYIDRLTSKFSDMNVGCSGAVREYLIDQGVLKESQCRVIHNGIDLDLFPAPQAERWESGWGIGPKDKVIIYIGRLSEPEKGLRCLIDSAAEILRGRAGIKILIVGEGPAEDQLKRQAEKYNISGQVIFAGARKDIAPILSASYLLVLPSRWEGFGLVLLEAMAAEKPVVATRVGGIPEVVEEGKTGVLVPPGNARALTEAISYLLDHPEQAREMGKAGRKRVEERFSLGEMTRQMQALYEELWARRVKQ